MLLGCWFFYFTLFDDFFILLYVEERCIFCCILKCFTKQNVVSGMLESLPVSEDRCLCFLYTIVLLSKGVLYNNSSGPQISRASSNTGLTRALNSLIISIAMELNGLT